jgi:hypothetical protein
MKKLSIIICCLLATISAFGQKKYQVTNYNIIFSPDLSNRLNSKLYPRAISDPDIVSGVLKRIDPDILRLGRLTQQLDHYSVDFINKGLVGIYKVNTDLLHLDFERFTHHQDARIKYVKGTQYHNLNADIRKFMSEYTNFNNKASISNNGADIWTYFNSGIDDRIVKRPIVKGNTTNNFRNILVMMTDGYIEAGIYNKGYDLNMSKVNNFRNAFLKSKGTDLALFLVKNPHFKINSVKNPYLSNLEVIVLEMYDRSLSKAGAATKHPTDMEIMKVIWKDWLKSSGVKRFELKPTANNQEEAVKYVMDFISKK